jgi:hypothetical protein
VSVPFQDRAHTQALMRPLWARVSQSRDQGKL